VRAADCLDLPDHMDEFRSIEMKPDQSKIYKQMKTQYIAEIKNYINDQRDPIHDVMPSTYAVANVALTKLMKLRQITSSFVIDDKGNEIAIGPNPKMDELLDIVEECGQEQIIIWCQFHWEIKQIAKEISKIGGVSILYGEIDQKDRQPAMEKFLNGENRFLIAHPRTVAHGHNLQYNSHVMVFFSLSYSFEEYEQARGRIMRRGQERNCVYFHLLAKNSIDEDLLSILQKKTTIAQIAEKYLK
jgi:SNF2 family DNA or RNA helicase